MSENNQNQDSNDQKDLNQEDQNPDKENNNDQKELTLGQKLKESDDKLLRSLAEIENQRRRFEKEIKDAFEYGSYNFAKESLAILDNLKRAKLAIKNDETLKDNKDLNKFLENIQIIERDLVTIFEKNGIKKIETKNMKFDPNLHQAMSEIEDEKAETGNILQEIQAGYMLGERLLRPALVEVAKKKMKEKEEINKNKENK